MEIRRDFNSFPPIPSFSDLRSSAFICVLFLFLKKEIGFERD